MSKDQVNVSWAGPSTPPAPFVAQFPPLVAAQLVMMAEEMGIQERATVSPKAFEGLLEFFEQMRRHLDAVDKSNRARAAASAAIFSGAVSGPTNEDNIYEKLREAEKAQLNIPRQAESPEAEISRRSDAFESYADRPGDKLPQRQHDYRSFVPGRAKVPQQRGNYGLGTYDPKQGVGIVLPGAGSVND